MLQFLCEGEATAPNGGSIAMYVVLIAVLAIMLIFPYISQRKKNKEYEAMINSITVGDLVKTAGGIIGKITKIMDKGDIKTVILETGSKTEKSYMEFDMTMIYCVLKSTKAPQTENEENNSEVSSENEESQEVEQPATEEVQESSSNETKQENKETDNAKVKEDTPEATQENSEEEKSNKPQRKSSYNKSKNKK